MPLFFYCYCFLTKISGLCPFSSIVIAFLRRFQGYAPFLLLFIAFLRRFQGYAPFLLLFITSYEDFRAAPRFIESISLWVIYVICRKYCAKSLQPTVGQF